MRIWHLACVALACAMPGVTAAQSDDFEQCHKIEDRLPRLDCYDQKTKFKSRADVMRAAQAPVPTQETKAAAAMAPSLLQQRWGLVPPRDGKGEDSSGVREHQAMYLMPGRYTTHVNRQPFSAQSEFQIAAGDTPPGPVLFQRAEMKFQYSLKARPWRSEDHTWGAWLAFTQQSFWQVYNGGLSRPFRETNYMPEAILTWQPHCGLADERAPCDVAGLRWRLVNFGYAHQSNGRGQGLSRNWNRLYAQFGFDRRVDESNDIALLVRPWVRIRENPAKDDNPDITDFLGHGDVVFFWKRPEGTFTFTGRGNPRTRKGGALFEYSFNDIGKLQKVLGPFHLYVQFFTGYGESLIDYNWRQTTFGVGLSLNDSL